MQLQQEKEYNHTKNNWKVEYKNVRTPLDDILIPISQCLVGD